MISTQERTGSPLGSEPVTESSSITETVENQSPQVIARSKSQWSWTKINFFLDAALLVNFLIIVWISAVIRFVFPSASAAEGWSLWGLGIDDWMGVHFSLIAVFTLGILVHLMLHWSWVCGVLFGKLLPNKKGRSLPDDGTRTIYGVGLMIVILNVMGLLMAAAVLSVQSPL